MGRICKSSKIRPICIYLLRRTWSQSAADFVLSKYRRFPIICPWWTSPAKMTCSANFFGHDSSYKEDEVCRFNAPHGLNPPGFRSYAKGRRNFTMELQCRNAVYEYDLNKPFSCARVASKYFIFLQSQNDPTRLSVPNGTSSNLNK